MLNELQAFWNSISTNVSVANIFGALDTVTILALIKMWITSKKNNGLLAVKNVDNSSAINTANTKIVELEQKNDLLSQQLNVVTSMLTSLGTQFSSAFMNSNLSNETKLKLSEQYANFTKISATNFETVKQVAIEKGKEIINSALEMAKTVGDDVNVKSATEIMIEKAIARKQKQVSDTTVKV
jgi:hypothetical protein